MVIKFGNVPESEEGGRTGEDINDCWLVACPFKFIARFVLLCTFKSVASRDSLASRFLFACPYHASALVSTTPH